MKLTILFAVGSLTFGIAASSAFAQESAPPNILAIMVDDVAQTSLSAYSHGMQYPTPNIDRIAAEGALFTDHYAQPSCTAGRAAFLMGQLPVRTGLTTVGQPGNPLGIQPEDPTLAEVLKEQGYMTGQFGKNHLGDLDEHLPTKHGFDEFFGNLYHLNVSEEPEQADYPKTPEFLEKFGPRGVIESFADGEINDTGPLTKKRMETFDEEVLARTINFMERAVDQQKPFFIWHAPSRMHVYTHLKDESRNLATGISSEEDLFGSGLIEHDGHVGSLLDKIDELGIADNTIVLYTTDNGPESGTQYRAVRSGASGPARAVLSAAIGIKDMDRRGPCGQGDIRTTSHVQIAGQFGDDRLVVDADIRVDELPFPQMLDVVDPAPEQRGGITGQRKVFGSHT